MGALARTAGNIMVTDVAVTAKHKMQIFITIIGFFCATGNKCATFLAMPSNHSNLCIYTFLIHQQEVKTREPSTHSSQPCLYLRQKQLVN